MSNAERFLNAFVVIEGYLRQTARQPNDTSFPRLLDLLSPTDALVRRYAIDLKEFAELRNALVHRRARGGEVIAEPHPSVVELIERIAGLLADPPRVIPLFQRQVYVLASDDTLAAAVHELRQRSVSQAPVYSGKEFSGLLTSGVILRWLGGQPTAIVDLAATTVGQVLAFAAQHEQVHDRVGFLSRSATVAEALEHFQHSQQAGKALVALLLTENGKPSERPLGIITTHDLPQIQAQIG